MALASIQAALVQLLASLNVGAVDATEGRQESLPWGDPNQPNLPFWTVTLVRSNEKDGEGRTLGAVCLQHTWALQGYWPHNFEAETGRRWLEYLDVVIDALKPNPGLTVCALTRPVRIVEQDYVLFRLGHEGGNVVCHFARMEFVTEEWVAY